MRFPTLFHVYRRIDKVLRELRTTARRSWHRGRAVTPQIGHAASVFLSNDSYPFALTGQPDDPADERRILR